MNCVPGQLALQATPVEELIQAADAGLPATHIGWHVADVPTHSELAGFHATKPK